MPFSAYERMIAWRYLRARRADGGVAVMTWISLIGVTLAVFALVATLAVRAGLRADFLAQMLGAQAHVELRYTPMATHNGGGTDDVIRDAQNLVPRLEALEGVAAALPVVRGQVLGSLRRRTAPVDVHGIAPGDIAHFDWAEQVATAFADPGREVTGIALGRFLAQRLGATLGDRVTLLSPNGLRTAFGTAPRVSAYEVVAIFSSGQTFIDQSRAYLPLDAAQVFFSREGGVDQIDLFLNQPEALAPATTQILAHAGPRAILWTWQDRFGDTFRALRMQDNAIFIVLAILVLIAALNIVSGLIMLVKNKTRDIGILRSMGLGQGAILRIFLMCGATIGTAGTIFGMLLGTVFAFNIDHIYALVDWLTARGVAGLEARGFIFPSARLEAGDILATAALSLGLSWGVTFFPARRAARLDPVAALRDG